jgi:hypothetical protein
MMTTGSTTKNEQAESPPLTIPRDVWEPLPSSEKIVWRRAGKMFEHLTLRETITLSDMSEATGFPIEQLLEGLRALGGMNLIEFENDGKELVIKLIAVPDEHVRIVGPDDKTRWLFVARPLVAPDIAPGDLN